MSKWQYTKGLHDLANGCYAWLQPDGSWVWKYDRRRFQALLQKLGTANWLNVLERTIG